MIRENQSENLISMLDDFGGKRLSRRKLEEIYVNVIIQDGREITLNSRRRFTDRHAIYDVHLEQHTDARILTSTEELFQATKAIKDHPRTVLVVGRPGIGKTLLTEKYI